MKHVLAILALVLCLTANGQELLQLNGKFHHVQRGDSVRVTIWSMGDVVDDYYIYGRFYATTMGERPIYTVLFRTGVKEKLLTVHTTNFNHDTAILDVDFSIKSEAILKKPNANRDIYVIETIDAKGNFRELTYSMPNTGDNRR